MLRNVLRRQVLPETLPMPNQDLRSLFLDDKAPGLNHRRVPSAMRSVLFGLPLLFSGVVAVLLVMAFQNDSQLTAAETILIALMALLAGWEALPSANAIIGIIAKRRLQPPRSEGNLTVAILATIRDENANDVISGKLKLLRSLQNAPRHSFVLHILSDSSSVAQVAQERHLIAAAPPVSVFHHHRPFNVDFKSGNIRNWISNHGAAHDAFIILDADSELDSGTALALADSLADDQACGLIQAVPMVLPGGTRWQRMQSIASRYYGELQGEGLSAWMGDEANYYGHNAIIRTKVFAACAGLPHLKGHGLWNGTILSHDFVEAALLRRAGWAVRLLPNTAGSFELAPTDVIAHLKRDARWCLGNFQHSRILGAKGLHPLSRFHLLSGIFAYLSSVVWLAIIAVWALLDSTRASVGGNLAASAFALIALNLLLPRVLGTLDAARRKPSLRWKVFSAALIETLFSSLFAASLMLQRVKIIGSVLANQRVAWAPFEKSNHSLVDYCVFHGLEVLSGLGLLACVERGSLTLWFLPLAVCLAGTPLFSWFAAQHVPPHTHEKLIAATPL